MKRLLAGAILLGATLAGLTPQAHAGVFSVTVWEGNGSGNITDPQEQALPTNPLNTPSALLGSFTYTGSLNWAVTPQPQNYLDTFVGTGGGSVTGCTGSGACLGATTLAHTLLSSAPFAVTTLFDIVFTTTSAVTGVVTHDDGVSIWNSNNSLQYLTGASAPTSAVPSNFSLPSAGTYNLWYVQANGAPSVLDLSLTAVPEPGALAMFALGAGLLGFVTLRRKKSFG